jgi:hypothetical protein
MVRTPQRIIEAAIIDRIGAVTAHELLSMPDDRWGLIRDRITDSRHGKDDLVARCMGCGGDLYIRTSKLRGIARPLFQHYTGSDPNCPWYQGGNIDPNDARAAQYQGLQESLFHRQMCEQIAQLVSLDHRYLTHTVEAYLPPTENTHGRFPDIYVEWAEYGPFAIEFQMSGTFQTEISARCKHYEREGIPLIWVLFGIDTVVDLPQSIVDFIRRHRGNAFVLDQAAVAASREQKTLVLSCHLRNANGSLAPPTLVRLDQLTIPRSKLPYFEDRIVEPRLAEIENLRRPWFEALTLWEADRYKKLIDLGRPQSVLLAAAFSIVATANGRVHNYASEHDNLTAMLNTYISTRFFSSYTDLLARLIDSTTIGSLLKPSVKSHLSRYRNQVQADEQSEEWQLLRRLLPEALDPVLREELIYLDAMPKWAAIPPDRRH